MSEPISNDNRKPSNAVEKPRDKFGTRHFQILVMSMCLAVGMTIQYSLPLAIIAMTDTKEEFSHSKSYNWTNSEISLILSAYVWGYAVFQIPSSYIVSFWSARKLFALSLFSSSLINISLPFFIYYGDWIALAIGRAIIGLCHGCFSSSIVTLLSKWAPPKERSRLGSFVTTGTVLGAVVAMSVSGLIASSSLRWPGIFYIFGSFGIVTSLLLFQVITDSPTKHASISTIEKKFILSSFEEVNNYCKIDKQNPPWKSILTSLPVWALIITECGSSWGACIIATEMPIYMKHVLDYNLRENGLVSTLPYLANYILSFPFSWIADFLTKKRLSISQTRKTMNSIAMWGSALALIALCLVDNGDKKWPVTLFILSVGLKAGTASGYIVNQIDLSQNFAGAIYSMTTCIGTLISMSAPIYCGIVIKDLKNANQWHIVFYTTAFIQFFTNLVFVIFGRGKIQSWNNPENKATTNPS